MDIAQKLFGRMTEMEKIQLRMATEAGVEFLAHGQYGRELYYMGCAECDNVKVMNRVLDLAIEQFTVKSNKPTVDGIAF